MLVVVGSAARESVTWAIVLDVDDESVEVVKDGVVRDDMRTGPAVTMSV